MSCINSMLHIIDTASISTIFNTLNSDTLSVNKKQLVTKAYLLITWLFYQITSLEACGSQTQSTERKKKGTVFTAVLNIFRADYLCPVLFGMKIDTW